ncbi:hypothetical protein [Enterococcus hirae]|uniref:hypothetical protein n=1 Tax=Enterococcus hirae TaxID=1354 RepID=UPI00136A5425|nr:hypothetical protein [Enterococcus hirae]NAE18059.1 hypothetical protein [Enterococcus hirae]
MLLAYDESGAVIFQIGINSLFPEGPPEDALSAMFAEVGVTPIGWVRLSDITDTTLVQDVLLHGATIEDGAVVPAIPTPQPAEPTVTGQGEGTSGSSVTSTSAS